MSATKPVHELVKYLHKSDRSNQILILKDIGASIQYATLTDIQNLLSFVSKSEDIEVTIKLFSMLTLLCMGAENECKETILTDIGIYGKLYQVIRRGLPFKSTIVLNFITALVHFDGNSPKRKLAQYAKNMTRVSGCLAALIRFTINKIMHIDTWRAICQCLAECCRHSDINQEYCMELIPMCIEKTRQNDESSLVLLFSLLQGNKLNCERFIAQMGHLIFTRENLEKQEYIEILGCVVDSCPELATSFRNTRLPMFLQDILLTYGPHSKIGQWCSIILYYINLYDNNHEKQSSSSNGTNKSECMPNLNLTGISQNTSAFYENVMREICKFNNIGITRMCAPNAEARTVNVRSRAVPLSTEENDSFSDGRTENTTNKNKNIVQNNNSVDKYCQTDFRNYLLEQSREIKDVVVASSLTSQMTLNNSITFENTFKPQFHSTRKIFAEKSSLFKKPMLSKKKNNESNNPKYKGSNVAPSDEKLQIKFDSSTLNDKDISNNKCKGAELTKSLSSSIFDVINTSCSTIVRKVKSILSPGTPSQSQEDLTINSDRSNYNFMSYMKKRDLILNYSKKEKLGANKKHLSSSRGNMCETCNDTRILKSKLKNNVYLRRTVKKLKIGINLYGCDFKKLSKALWPNETYMTPSVLYCLYRKLILK